jgi:predicted GIY-YIG superfamily endonuclease
MTNIYLYILESSDGSYYTGTTKDLEKRLYEHNNGIGSYYTMRRRPVKLVFCEGFEKYYDAFSAERQIKNWSRKKEALINRDFDELVRLSNFKKHPSTSSG